MYCNNCGKEISEGSKFCNCCGQIVQGNESNKYIKMEQTAQHLSNIGKTLTLYISIPIGIILLIYLFISCVS